MKRLSKEINSLAYRHSIGQVFDDFMEMAICAFSFGRMEDKYTEITRRYNPDEIKQFGNVLGAMLLDYEDCSSTDGDWDDVLGNFFESTSSGAQASRMGQFFTPIALCNMMARITTGEIKEDATCCDPACGSGRNLIAHSRINIDTRLKCFYTGMDLDRRCVNMTVLNMFLYGMKGVVIHMNSLSLEVYSGYRVFLGETGMGIMPLNKEQCKQYVYSYEPREPVTFEKPLTIIPMKAEQLRLL
jgi:type I restriction enzyme M protein